MSCGLAAAPLAVAAVATHVAAPSAVATVPALAAGPIAVAAPVLAAPALAYPYANAYNRFGACGARYLW